MAAKWPPPVSLHLWTLLRCMSDILKCYLNEWQWSVLWLYQIQNREGSCSICILDFPLFYRNSRVLVYWNEHVSEVRLYLTSNDDMWLRLLYILRQWFCCRFVVDCCSWCGFCSMVCCALLCVFSRFALLLMLASATSMWERRLDLKVYVFLLTIPWLCFFCGSFLLLMFRVCHAILSSIYCSLVVACLERADLLALLYVVIYCVLSLPDGVSWVKCGTWVYRLLIFAFFLTLRNESKLILCLKRWPKNCCLAHMRKKLFNKGGKPAMPTSILVEGYCKNVHTSMHAHIHQCTYENTCTCP